MRKELKRTYTGDAFERGGPCSCNSTRDWKGDANAIVDTGALATETLFVELF